MDIKERIEGNKIYLNREGSFPKTIIFQRIEGNRTIEETRILYSSMPGKYRLGSKNENRS